MRKILLTQNQFALVDNDDYDYINQWKWCAKKIYDNVYCAVRVGKRPRRERIYMHRVIMNVEKTLEIDHIDGNPLNNQKYNLRICKHSENMLNRKKKKTNTTGYKGVRPTSNNKYQALICVNGKQTCIGTFENPIDAARAYDQRAKKLHGDFARLNFS